MNAVAFGLDTVPYQRGATVRHSSASSNDTVLAGDRTRHEVARPRSAASVDLNAVGTGQDHDIATAFIALGYQALHKKPI